jgi:hypothetical protein
MTPSEKGGTVHGNTGNVDHDRSYCSIHMKFSMTGQEKAELLIQATV